MKILGVPLYYAHNVGKDLLPILQESIESLQQEKNDWLRHRSKVSIYTKEGDHKFPLKIDPMEGVEGWKDLKLIIKEHVMNFYDEVHPIDYDYQQGPDIALREELNAFWYSNSWYTYFDETDSYPWHSHGQFYFIATYYAQAEEEHAPIQFKSPMSDMYTAWALGTKSLNLEETIQPKSGDLIIWPGWLEHQIPAMDTNLAQQAVKLENNNKYKHKRISITSAYVKPHAQFLYNAKGNYEQK